MTLFTTRSSAAQRAARDYGSITELVASKVSNRWPSAYPYKPEEYQATVTRSRPVMDGDGQPTGAMEDYEATEPAIRMVPDIEGSQAFFDDAGVDGLGMLIGHALVGNAANYTHLLASGAEIPDEVRAAGMQFFGAALALRDACEAAGLLDALPVKVMPPVALTPQADGSILVSAKA